MKTHKITDVDLKEFFCNMVFESFGIATDEEGNVGMSLIFFNPAKEKTYCLNIGNDKTMNLV